MSNSKQMKRVTFRVSSDTYEKMEQICERYGISINALCSYVMGRWVEENYDLRDRVLDRFTKVALDDNKFFDNPVYQKMMEDIVRAAIDRMVEAETRKAQSGA